MGISHTSKRLIFQIMIKLNPIHHFSPLHERLRCIIEKEQASRLALFRFKRFTFKMVFI
jgi:hypothetical protein